jgi:hypothetical protein
MLWDAIPLAAVVRASPGSFSSPLHVLRSKAVRLLNLPLLSLEQVLPRRAFAWRQRGGWFHIPAHNRTFHQSKNLAPQFLHWRLVPISGSDTSFDPGQKNRRRNASLHRSRCTDSLNQDTDSPGRQQSPPAAEASLQVSCIPLIAAVVGEELVILGLCCLSTSWHKAGRCRPTAVRDPTHARTPN